MIRIIILLFKTLAVTCKHYRIYLIKACPQLSAAYESKNINECHSPWKSTTFIHNDAALNKSIIGLNCSRSLIKKQVQHNSMQTSLGNLFSWINVFWSEVAIFCYYTWLLRYVMLWLFKEWHPQVIKFHPQISAATGTLKI